jgi:hypothetical protein
MPNYDETTGIHYGCISQHSLDPDALSDIFDNGVNMTYNAAVSELKKDIRNAIRDLFYSSESDELAQEVNAIFDNLSDRFSDRYDGCGEEQYLYEQDGYKLSNSPSLVCIFVERSEFYTYARECSPCVPNAGDLDHADGSLKTYCLGHDWFEDDKAPYPVYSVADDARK